MHTQTTMLANERRSLQVRRRVKTGNGKLVRRCVPAVPEPIAEDAAQTAGRGAMPICVHIGHDIHILHDDVFHYPTLPIATQPP